MENIENLEEVLYMPDNAGSDATGLQKKINRLQAENMVLRRLLDVAGVSYAMELKKLEDLAKAEAFDPDQGARIIPPREYTRLLSTVPPDMEAGMSEAEGDGHKLLKMSFKTVQEAYAW